MKKLVSVLSAVALVCAVCLTGCGGAPKAESAPSAPLLVGVDGDIVEISEKLFIAGVNDVYLNPDDYAGKLVKLEGMYDLYADPAIGAEIQSVIRGGPGCCGNDGVAGFEFAWEGEKPEQNDWIEVIGAVEKAKNQGGFEYIILRAVSVRVLDERGAEYVSA